MCISPLIPHFLQDTAAEGERVSTGTLVGLMLINNQSTYFDILNFQTKTKLKSILFFIESFKI